MSPILSLEAEISAALKTASAPKSMDLLAEIRAGIKLAGEAAPVTPPSPTAPVAKPPAAPAPAAGAPAAGTPASGPAPRNLFSEIVGNVGNALQPATGRPAPGAVPAPQAGKPTTPAPAPTAAQNTSPPPAAESQSQQPGQQPDQQPVHRPKAPEGALSQGWNAVKNNWDVAAIPLSLLAMMFGGKTGKMLGMLGMAAGSYGLYNRYKTLTNFGEGIERKEGEGDATFAARQQAAMAQKVKANFQAAESKRTADAKYNPLITAAQTELDGATKQLTPEQAALVPGVLQARTAMLDAQEAAREIQQKNPQDVEGVKAAQAQAAQAAQEFGKLNPNGQFNGVVGAQQKLDTLRWQHQKALSQWSTWQQKNQQLSDSIKGIMAMGGGGMIKAHLAGIKGLEGATDRTVQDLMYRLGHADKPAVYSKDFPLTPGEREADRHLNWMLTTEDAPEKIQAGGPGIMSRAGDAILGAGQNLFGDDAPSWHPRS